MGALPASTTRAGKPGRALYSFASRGVENIDKG